MPIKLPKGFPRRKSSGNVLDEVSNPKEQNESTSSFKVLARPQSVGKSLDGGSTLHAIEDRPRPPPKSSFEIDNEELFSVVRGAAPNRSSGTTNSLTTLPNDSTASSRYSNSSTNPSSVDSGSSRNVKPTGQRYYEDNSGAMGHVSKPSFLKNAGRTFSFGIGKQHNQSRDTIDLPQPASGAGHRSNLSNVHQRERSMTESSVSTAAPPRLDDHTFSIKASTDDDFGNMFAHLGTKSSRENLSSSGPTPASQSAQRAAPPRPIQVNKNAAIESSLPSWNSPGSRDGLINASSPARTVIHDSPNFSKPSTLRSVTMDTIRSEEALDDNVFENTPLHRSPESQSVKPYSSPRSRAPPSAFPMPAATRARTRSTGNSSIQKSDAGSEYEQPAFDPSLLANAQLASQYENRVQQTQHTPQSKVMTPAEFERYRQQKEDTRKYNKVFGKADSDDGSGDDYDDDEEDDREREQAALKQRKKQEAHLAVYRQQMMKVTGDSAPGALRPGTGSSAAPANSSQPDLSLQDRRMSQLTLNPNLSQYGALGRLPVDTEPDEDEDVPLGILAAHGFPNKNKPPSRLVSSSSNPNLRSFAQTSGGASVVGDASNRGSLPAFARHLPADPYYGAGLVHQSERAPLAMHSNTSSPHLASQPQPSGAATAHPLHPAGLVGVIAGEERARAMRRGSPNAQSAQFEMPPPPPNMRPQMMNPYQQQGMMMPQQTYSPAEQAQLQMSQNMTQMMQMQMQWMQQMSSMMGPNATMPMNPMMGMPGMPGMPMMPQMQQNGIPMMPTQPQQQHPGLPHRPQSVPLQGQLPTHRTMSSLSPSMAGWNVSSPAVPQFNTGGSVYAQSIAPSERSNVGLAPRYRPVTTGQQDPEQPIPSWQKRSSTFSSATFRPWTNGPTASKPSVPTIRSVSQNIDDDDDEQGWAEMKARKETKQKSWRLRKGGNNSLKELYNAPV